MDNSLIITIFFHKTKCPCVIVDKFCNFFANLNIILIHESSSILSRMKLMQWVTSEFSNLCVEVAIKCEGLDSKLE